jgi:hypothetical protein
MKHGKTRPKMTRKQALAVLHKLDRAVSWYLGNSEEERAIEEQLFDAFRVLDLALYGDAIYTRPLCQHCYFQLCPYDHIQVCAKGQAYHTPCCPTCFERLKAARQVEYIQVWNEKRQKWEKKEVPQ